MARTLRKLAAAAVDCTPCHVDPTGPSPQKQLMVQLNCPVVILEGSRGSRVGLCHNHQLPTLEPDMMARLDEGHLIVCFARLMTLSLIPLPLCR